MRREMVPFLKLVLLTFLLLFGVRNGWSQSQLRGRVIDKTSKLPISGALVENPKNKSKISSDADGGFVLMCDAAMQIISIRAMGYAGQNFEVKNLNDTIVDFLLEPASQMIETVNVTKKGKYNRRNPATELIDLVIQHKKYNKLSRKDSLSFEKYDKVKFGLINPSSSLQKSLKGVAYFFKNMDTSLFVGEKALTMFMQEDISDNFVKQSPAQTKKIIKWQKKTELDPRYVNNPNIQSYMNYLFQEVDIYDESVFFINKLFLSPIADNAKLYYKYYVSDTIAEGRDLSIRIKFEPFNTTDLLFSGELIVPLDGSYAVKSAKLNTNKSTNISWVNSLHIDLDYTRDTGLGMLLAKSRTLVAFGNRKDAVFGERTSINYKYSTGLPLHENVFLGPPIENRVEQYKFTFIDRPVQLNKTEQLTYAHVDSLNHNKGFRGMMAAGYLIAQGYYTLGKFELGPLEYLLHRNNLEGTRFRVGGRTTSLFSEKVYGEGYLAYGTKDQDLKYYLKTAVSINGKPVTQFPAHYFEGSMQHDIFEPGKTIGFLKGDSFFRSFRSNRPNKWMLTDAYRLGHVVEFGNHFSLSTHFTVQNRQSVGDLKFMMTADSTQSLQNINTNDLQFVLRWAPFEKFYYRNMSRNTIKEKYPVFNLQYNKGIEGFLGGDYNYDALRFSASKRFFLNQLGFADMTMTAGKIWGTLPYPLLEMPNIQEQKDRHTISYEKVNSMEFVADQFLKFSYDHELNGFILNKLPLIKKLKWREIFGVNMFWGKLSDHNNPYLSNSVVYFDHDADGRNITHVLGNSPYWEGFVGLDNIFRVLRVQYYARLNYKYQEESFRDRIRLSLRFNF